MMMSMCKVAYFVVGRGCLLWPVCSLGKTLLAFALLHFVLQGQTCLSRFLLTSYFCIPIPYGEKNIFFGFSSRKARKSCRPSEIWSISASSALKGQGSLAWCSSWRFKELYMTYQLNNNNQKVLEVFTERINFSFFDISGWGIDLDYCDTEWLALEMNWDFLSFLKLLSSTPFWILVDYEGYYISSKGFLPTAVDIMIICIKFAHSHPF